MTSRWRDALARRDAGHPHDTPLKHLGCVTEIITWRTRVFIALDDTDMLGAVLERCPIDPGHLDAA